MKQEDAKALAILGLTATAIVIIFVFYKQITTSLSSVFGADESDKKANKAADRTEKQGYFNEVFIRNPPPGTLLLKMEQARIKSSNIFTAIGVVYDNPERIKAAFSNIATKSQVAFLAFVFKQMYNRDLLTFLREKLDTDSQQRVLTEILTRLDKLPNFTK